MPLIKRREITEKQLSANRRNITLSHGPITPEGRERIRSAHIRHGFYAADIETSMRALGEDPAHLQDLTEGLWAEFDPQGSMQEGLVIRLARSTWLMNRADRMQEGYGMRRAQDLNMGRDDRSHAYMMRLKIAADSLRRLAQSVQREHYVTTPADLELMKNLQQERMLKDMGEIAVTLFYQLQVPGTGEDGIDPEEKSRRALVKFKAIFGLSGDEPPKPRSALNSPSAGEFRRVDWAGHSYDVTIGPEKTALARDGKARFEASAGVVVREYQAEPSRLTFRIKGDKPSHIATREFDSGQFNLSIDGKSAGKITIRNGLGDFDVPAGEHIVQLSR